MCPTQNDVTGVGDQVIAEAAAFKQLQARWVDNGDGTVSDTQTGLMWEQKDGLGGGANLSDPHDVDNTYTWSAGPPYNPTGTAFTGFLYGLNGGTSPDGVATSGCFAGHCDWRLPTAEELQTILLAPFPCGTNPCIDPVFGPTQSLLYWSATTDAGSPFIAWLVNFYAGLVDYNGKTFFNYVRAVRGGL